MSQYNVQLQDGNGSLAGLRNQLINGNFEIWQHSTDATVDGASTAGCVSADRWYFAFNGRYFRRSETPNGFRYSLQVSSTDPNITTYALRQGIEMLDSDGNTNATPFELGSTWTLSFWTTGSPDSTGGVFRLYAVDAVGNAETGTQLTPDVNVTSTGETSNGFTRYSATATVNASTASGSGVTAISCFLGGLTEYAANGRFTGFQLEPGPIVTPFEQRPIELELALCQRYFYSLNVNASTGHTPLAAATGASGNKFRCLFVHPVQMRTLPSFSSTGSFRVVSSTDIAVSSLAGDRAGLVASSITANVGVTVGGDAGMLQTNNDATARASFDAEL